MKRPKSYASVWDAIADTPEQAANLRARAQLMEQIADLVKKKGWRQAEAAKRCGVTQPLINDLLRGRVSRLSLDALVNIVAHLGLHIRFELEGGPSRKPANAKGRQPGLFKGVFTVGSEFFEPLTEEELV